MGKTRIVVHAKVPSEGKPYLLVPYGRYFNDRLLRAGRGDLLSVGMGWRPLDCVLRRRCRLKASSPMFGFMFGSLYGDGASLEGEVARWRAYCVLEGYGEGAFDAEDWVLVEVEPLE